MKKKPSKSTIILVVIFLVGISLMLYPIVSDYWNSFHQSRAIASYMEQVNNMDDAEYNALLTEAQNYNASIAQNGNNFAMNDEQKEQFLSLLGSNGGAIGYIDIPSIKVSLPLYLGTSEGVLQSGAGVMEGSSVPIGGESTHSVITGHRGLPSATLFTHLDRLVEGDLFSVNVLKETCVYEINQILIVEPQDMNALNVQIGKDLCTLVTCTPYGINTHRMLITGHRIETPEDMLYTNVASDAVQFEPAVIAPVIAAPILLILMFILLFSSGKKNSKSLNYKKGGNNNEKNS